jgi:hypothetical protein
MTEKNSKKPEKNKEKLIKEVEETLARWNRMMAGDMQALIEIMVERGMATKKDFPDYFR